MALLTGCVHQKPSARFSEEDIGACKQAAIEAANSPEMRSRFAHKMFSEGPFRVDTTRVEYTIEFEHPWRITVTMPSDQFLGDHPCYIDVEMELGSRRVIEMRESFLP